MFSTTDLFLSPCFWFFPPSAASQSVIILFHLTSINLFCSKPPCWPPTFCPLALTINTNNHIQDLVPNNIRHAERLLSEVSSGILQHDMGKNSVGKTEKEKKFSLDWFFCWHLQQIKKEKKRFWLFDIEKVRLWEGTNFSSVCKIEFAFGIFYLFLLAVCILLTCRHLQATVIAFSISSLLSDSYKRSRDTPMWDFSTKRTKDNTQFGLKITI